jgi:hypothetical protein
MGNAGGHPGRAPGRLARLGASSAALVSVLAGKALIALGLRRAPEGWRRTVGVLLRSEPTRFALSSFGLQVPAPGGSSSGVPGTIEARVAGGLLSFLASEPDAHFALEWRSPVTVRRRTPVVDVVVLHFGRDGALGGIEPWLGPVGPAAPPADTQARVHQAIVSAYTRTAGLPEVERPRALLGGVSDALAASGTDDRREAEAYARRLLAACCLSFEERDLENPAQRFCPPAFSARRTLGFGYLSIVARPDARRGLVDVWASAHHVGLDGVPLQDLLSRLERAWGMAGPVVFPAGEPGRAFIDAHACHAPGERQVRQLIAFVDLSPVLEVRRQLNARHAAAIGGRATFGAVLAWLLNREPEFAGVRIASTVDVPASNGYERDVDVVALRPADYVTGSGPWDGFVEFAREFNRLIAACRARTSPVRAGMQTAGLLPAWVHSTVVRANPAALDETFGTLCVTIVREGKVFVAPMTDLGLGHGFFAIGNACLPAADGGRVACVSIKGEGDRAAAYPAVLQRLIDRCEGLQSSVPDRDPDGPAEAGHTNRAHPNE